ncbi:hypothetical protein SSABA_v1c07710 [Spiroplasma sabaudiense Ar-1343]|uniref:Uncharacterized protein n=1 Tax=Spiroplasma sabaudiense Ar-1343 TaxID=1276257 RepID=W6AAG3_9MOLU|nr:hypothetical protein [Spiroplasma sabaudiense]AHI54173.1 hypothetical protein SSABA_v1c07710 [Spiroplasma sabaudiense Ar-1343]
MLKIMTLITFIILINEEYYVELKDRRLLNYVIKKSNKNLNFILESKKNMMFMNKYDEISFINLSRSSLNGCFNEIINGIIDKLLMKFNISQKWKTYLEIFKEDFQIIFLNPKRYISYNYLADIFFLPSISGTKKNLIEDFLNDCDKTNTLGYELLFH